MPSILDDIFETKLDQSRETIRLGDIKRDGGTQMRAGLDQPTVKEYADAMVSFGPRALPPLVVFYDGSNYWLADGFHRYAALEQVVGANGPVWCDVRAGTQRDAMLHAAGANASHGLRRTNSDKRRAVLALLQDPEWSQWSDGEIAKRCAVSQPFVSGLRKDFAPERIITVVRFPEEPVDEEDEGAPTHNGYESTPIVRKGADGRTINTANIGKTAKAAPVYAQIYELESVIRDLVGKATAQEVRAAARNGNGSWFYAMVKGVLDGRMDWRKSDLVQAFNNVAAQMEAKANGTNSPNLGTAGSVPVVTPATDKGPFFTPGANCDFKPSSPWMADWTEEDWAAHDAHKRKLQVEQATVTQQADAKPMAEWTAEEWAEAEADAERAALNAARRDAAIDILETYRQVLRTESKYSELTGDFMGTLPVIEGLRKMIAGLESLIEALQ